MEGMMWAKWPSCLVIDFKWTGKQTQFLDNYCVLQTWTSRYIKRPPITFKLFNNYVCCSALISLSGMENMTVPNASWMARLRECDRLWKQVFLWGTRGQAAADPNARISPVYHHCQAAFLFLWNLFTSSLMVINSFHGSKLCSRGFVQPRMTLNIVNLCSSMSHW